ncbi:16S rRNA (guanine(966)-N(2))-methyltransferase RsmD [Candidatus Portiera aleyrodidarum]|uniref:Ribosomal RNA small subunit methyltransferase D n=1 Tax=Candidatus Portiera aleyrodidarum TaxID=91844 RepID=A0A8D9NB29_9GAMM|nr:16S rRNA (guanine(966)-N(2))-methyltransferase RsmD [Candidatus Portiera aleyrodidarum]CEI58646.1 Ribosomal RNA small subunit methyltransferase D [Candidatus Portiera aleyrodidarum]
MIRLIGGNNKRSSLKFTARILPGIRPTLISVRETLFNWITINYIKNKNILDLYAGSGSLGFESISRGAKHVVFIENKKYLINYLYINRKKIKKLNSIKIIKNNSITYINKLAYISFDLVFIDPPFYHGLAYPTCNLLESNGWVNDNSLIYLEVESKLDLFFLPNSWRLYKETYYGKSHILLYRRALSNLTHKRK